MRPYSGVLMVPYECSWMLIIIQECGVMLPWALKSTKENPWTLLSTHKLLRQQWTLMIMIPWHKQHSCINEHGTMSSVPLIAVLSDPWHYWAIMSIPEFSCSFFTNNKKNYETYNRSARLLFSNKCLSSNKKQVWIWIKFQETCCM